MALFRLTAAILFIVLASSILGSVFAQTSGNVSVGGGILLRDGKPWEPKGVVVTGLVSAASTAGPVGPAYVIARQIWGPAEIAAIKGYGADTIDLKVSQSALDPLGGTYDPNYLTQIKAAVALARNSQLNVILSMKWGEQTGVTGQLDMPSDESVTAPLSSTTRAWRILAPDFGSDQGVMYQLFDEPCAKQDNPQVWGHWQSGHQSAINAIRRTGAKNILIVEGIRCAKWLTQVPALNDPLHRIVYGVHPYQMAQGVRRSNADMFTAADFDRNFGQWQAKGNVVITTEWDIWDATCHDGSDGNPTSPKIAADLLGYLKGHHTGLVVWAMDLPGTIWVDRNWRFLTRLLPFNGCDGGHFGIGTMVRDYFITGQTVPK